MIAMIVYCIFLKVELLKAFIRAVIASKTWQGCRATSWSFWGYLDMQDGIKYNHTALFVT